MTKKQAPKAQPTLDEIRDWIDSKVVEIPASDSELKPKYCSDDSLGWTPKFPESCNWGPAPFGLSRTVDSKYALVLFGNTIRFNRINTSSRVESRRYQSVVEGEEGEFDCTTVLFDNSLESKSKLVIIIHNLIIANRKDACLSPDNVCTIILPWLASGELELGDLLSENEQLGLFGELYLLKILLQLSEPENHTNVLSKWQGPNAKKRDFADTNQENENESTVAVECKATVNENRHHHISGVDQLNIKREIEGVEDLELYIFSIGVSNENEGSQQLIELALEIHDEILNPDSRVFFIEKINATGFLFDHERSYRRLEKYSIAGTFEPALIRVDRALHALVKDVIVVDEWTNKRWMNVQYTLDLTGLPNTISVHGENSEITDECSEILQRMIS
jgi:hypothetical protein